MSELTTRDIEQHLRTARGRAPDARVYGFHLPAGRVDLAEVEVDDERWRLVQAPSELAIREAMSQRTDDELLAIVTPLKARDLAIDVRIRLPKAELFGFDPWESLKSLFDATTLDWELARKDARPLGRALLRLTNGRGFPAVSAGVLDADTAWSTFFERALGFGSMGFENRPTRLADWFAWAATHPAHLDALLTGDLLNGDPELLELLTSRLTDTLGQSARTFFAALSSSD
jgi:hypothetical protein